MNFNISNLVCCFTKDKVNFLMQNIKEVDFGFGFAESSAQCHEYGLNVQVRAQN